MQPKQLAEQQINEVTDEFYEEYPEEIPILEPTGLKADFVKFIKYIFKRHTSSFVIVFGRRESGKTDFSLLLTEILFYHGAIKNFATNIHIYDSGDIPILKITNLEDLTFWARSTAGRKVFIFDELGAAFARRTPMSSLNVALIRKFQILRKFKLSIVGVTPSKKYVDNTSLGADLLDGIFLKPHTFKNVKRNQKLLLYYDYLERFRRKVDNLRGTRIKFDSYSTAPFKEHSPTKKPKLLDKYEKILWEWSHGARAKDLGLSRMQIHRITKKFIAEVLERQSNT